MNRKVIVRDEESIDTALRRLRLQQTYEYKRWTKKRYGYYEKPSELRRKRKKMARLWELGRGQGRNMQRQQHPQNHLHLFIGIRELFARTGASNAAGH